MKLKNATIKDIQSIYNIVITYKPYNGSKEKVDQSNLEEVIKKTIESGSEMIICEVDEKVVGYINAHYCFFPLIKGRECYISDLIVDKNFRGQGIGKALLAEVEERAKENGCKRLNLNNLRNIDSYKRSFYEKLGYTERDLIANFNKEL